jgi:uncharacterized protein YjbI with pentapeptide repeats
MLAGMSTFSDDTWLYEEVTLEGLDRPGCELPAVELYGCTIRGARLGGAILRRWVFEDCIFEDCDLSNAVLTECAFQGCSFTGCRLVGIDWRVVSPLTFEVSFEACALSYGVFAGMNLTNLKCADSDCVEVDFTEADLRKSAFPGTKLGGAIFAQTRLEHADLSQAIDDAVDPIQNRVRGARFSMEAAIRLAERFGIQIH